METLGSIGSAVQVQQVGQILEVMVPADYPTMLITLVAGLPFLLAGLVLLARAVITRSTSTGLTIMMASFILTPCLLLGLEYEPSDLTIDAGTGVAELRQVRLGVPKRITFRAMDVTGARVVERQYGDTLYLLLGASTQSLSGNDFMKGKNAAAEAISDFVQQNAVAPKNDTERK